MIFIFGDTHGELEINKLSSRHFPESKSLTENDFVIVCGDFGLVWENDRSDLYWQNWLKNKSFTTLFIDGNHENFNLLNNYTEEKWKGGMVHKINSKIFHLMRGNCFNINGYSFFVFGGAVSDDKHLRIRNISWWPQEEPSPREYSLGRKRLAQNGFKVDYIITHTCPASVLKFLKGIDEEFKKESEINKYFEEIKENTDFKHWFFGHFHIDQKINEKFTAIYKQYYLIE